MQNGSPHLLVVIAYFHQSTEEQWSLTLKALDDMKSFLLEILVLSLTSCSLRFTLNSYLRGAPVMGHTCNHLKSLDVHMIEQLARGWVSCDSWQVVNHPWLTAVWRFGIIVLNFMLYLVSLLVGILIQDPRHFVSSCSVTSGMRCRALHQNGHINYECHMPMYDNPYPWVNHKHPFYTYIHIYLHTSQRYIDTCM